MPFYNNVYYPFQSETQGTPSSAGIPSLLNSPQSQPSSSSGIQCGAPRMSTATSFPPFKFRPRRESVDWRRISAVDVDRVAGELDFQTLQDLVAGITFCNVEGERCPHCQAPVDPVLLKLLRLAQLTVEYLLHSQDCLTLSLQVAEDKLQASAQERELLQKQLERQAEEAKGLKEELRQRKKIIATQQSMITAGMGNYNKCQHCDKAFMNHSFLQCHMQRRHPEEYDIKLMSEKQKKVQSVKLQEEINKLKEQLTLTRSQLELQQQAFLVRDSREQDQRSKEEDLLKNIERWKDEARERQSKQMEEMRQMFQKESQELAGKNTQLQNQLSEMEEASRQMRVNIVALQEEKAQLSVVGEDRQALEIHKLQQLLRKQEEKWGSRLQKVQELHESEKSQLHEEMRRFRYSATEDQERNRRRIEDLGGKLQEQKELIVSQRLQVKQLASKPPERVVEHTVTTAVPEPIPRTPLYEQSASVRKLDPIEELSEEDKDSASVSEKKEVRKQTTISVLRKNPSLKRELRPYLEQTLFDKLESYGVKPGASRLSNSEYKNVLTQVSSEREKRAKMFPECVRVREDLFRTLSQKVNERRVEGSSAPEHQARINQPNEETHTRSRSSSLPSGVTRVGARPIFKPQVPQPAPRSKTSSLPRNSTPRTPPFSSGEDSEVESPQPQRPGQRPPPSRSAMVSVPRPVTRPVESESEWAEGSDMEEISPERLQYFGGQGPDRKAETQGHLVKDLTKKLEKQLADRGHKPVGGVDVLLEKKKVLQKPKGSKMDDVVDDDDDDDDDDDWDISSLEDKPSIPKPQRSLAPVKKSMDSSTTSVWGTSTGKTPKAETGSTPKSSLVTVSDWSDSDDI